MSTWRHVQRRSDDATVRGYEVYEKIKFSSLSLSRFAYKLGAHLAENIETAVLVAHSYVFPVTLSIPEILFSRARGKRDRAGDEVNHARHGESSSRGEVDVVRKMGNAKGDLSTDGKRRNAEARGKRKKKEIKKWGEGGGRSDEIAQVERDEERDVDRR